LIFACPRTRVVGAYTRFDEAVRNALQDARQKIVAGFEPPGRKRENRLIWAAPGSGKTYFVQQVATSLPHSTRYHELNLAKCTEPEFRSGLGALDGNKACLCLVDEVDAKPQDPWPYEVLLPYLDAAVDREARFVFVLAGSSGSSLDGNTITCLLPAIPRTRRSGCRRCRWLNASSTPT